MFAGATVVIALVGLIVVGIPFLTVMGLAAAGAVIVAVLIATTLLPALLGLLGKRAMRTNRLLTLRPRPQASGTEKASVRYARFVTRRPLVVVLVGLLVLGAAAVPATHMKLGLPDGGSKPTDNTERRAYDLLTEGFGPGFNGVLTVVVDAPGATAEQQERITLEATNRLEEMPNVAAVSPPSQNEAGDVTISMVAQDQSLVRRDQGPGRAYARAAEPLPGKYGINAYVTGTTA